MFDLSLAIGHHLLIFVLFGVLSAELVLVAPSLDNVTIARTARIDLWYGIVAGSIVLVGFARAIFAAKGWNYSIPPTLNYLAWQRSSRVPTGAQIAFVRRFLWAQVVLFALLPIFAAAMARGFGERAS